MMESFSTSQSTDLDLLRDIPGYKAILKTLIKGQIQHLVEQLSNHTGEEAVFLTVSTSDGSLSHLGSNSGKDFLDNHEDIKSKFLGFCLKKQHTARLATEKEAAKPSSFSSTPGRSPGSRTSPYPSGAIIRNRTKHTPPRPVKTKPSTVSSIATDGDQFGAHPRNDTGIGNVKTEAGQTSENFHTHMGNDPSVSGTDSLYSNTQQDTSSSQPLVSNFSGISATEIQNVKTEPETDEDLAITGVEMGEGISANQMAGTADWVSTSEAYMQNQSIDSVTSSSQDYSTHPTMYFGDSSDSVPQLHSEQSYSDIADLKSQCIERVGPRYKCTLCDRVFNRKDYVTKHILIHSGEKPYQCELCFMKFRHKNTLNVHMVRCQEKQYLCMDGLLKMKNDFPN